jgi:hypothetical protein
MNEINFVQLVDFITWFRTINGVQREPILYHYYASDPTSIKNVYYLKPIFGYHYLVHFNCRGEKSAIKSKFKRNRMLYNKDNFIKLLNRVDWLIQRDTVQGC